MHTRHCPNCDEEFRPDIPRCSDCGGELEDRYEDDDEGTPPAAKAVAPDPPGPAAQYRMVFLCADSSSLKEAADCLAAAGIRFRGDGNAAGFWLLVRADDVRPAAAALAGREGSLFASDDEAQPFVGVEGGICPACGTSAPAGELDCPGCGLAVGAEPPRCKACGAPLGPADTRCPVCHSPDG